MKFKQGFPSLKRSQATFMNIHDTVTRLWVVSALSPSFGPCPQLTGIKLPSPKGSVFKGGERGFRNQLVFKTSFLEFRHKYCHLKQMALKTP